MDLQGSAGNDGGWGEEKTQRKKLKKFPLAFSKKRLILGEYDEVNVGSWMKIFYAVLANQNSWSLLLICKEMRSHREFGHLPIFPLFPMWSKVSGRRPSVKLWGSRNDGHKGGLPTILRKASRIPWKIGSGRQACLKAVQIASFVLRNRSIWKYWHLRRWNSEKRNDRRHASSSRQEKFFFPVEENGG